jgi:hypothetical protein
MRPPTSLHEKHIGGPQNFQPPVQNDFCNRIGQKRTHAAQQRTIYSITSSARGAHYDYRDWIDRHALFALIAYAQVMKEIEPQPDRPNP